MPEDRPPSRAYLHSQSAIEPTCLRVMTHVLLLTEADEQYRYRISRSIEHQLMPCSGLRSPHCSFVHASARCTTS